MSTLLIGLGSPNGHDQLAWLIIDALTTQAGLSTFKSKSNGSDWFHEIGDHQQVIFIDAVLSDAPAGSIIEITSNSLNQLSSNSSSTHSVSLADSISLAKSLDYLKVPIRIIGIAIDQDHHFEKNKNELTKIITRLQQYLP